MYKIYKTTANPNNKWSQPISNNSRPRYITFYLVASVRRLLILREFVWWATGSWLTSVIGPQILARLFGGARRIADSQVRGSEHRGEQCNGHSRCSISVACSPFKHGFGCNWLALFATIVYGWIMLVIWLWLLDFLAIDKSIRAAIGSIMISISILVLILILISIWSSRRLVSLLFFFLLSVARRLIRQTCSWSSWRLLFHYDRLLFSWFLPTSCLLAPSSLASNSVDLQFGPAMQCYAFSVWLWLRMDSLPVAFIIATIVCRFWGSLICQTWTAS